MNGWQSFGIAVVGGLGFALLIGIYERLGVIVKLLDRLVTRE